MDWMPSYVPFEIGIITGNTSIPSFGPSVVKVQLNSTCRPGHRVQKPSFADLLEQLTKFSSVSVVRCILCQAPLFFSWQNDALHCLSLRWLALPRLLQSGQDVVASGISLINETLFHVKTSADMMLVVALVRGNIGNSPFACNASMKNGTSQSCTISRIVYQQSPGSDYSWLLELRSYGANISLLSIRLPSDGSVTVLDFPPVVSLTVPSSLSFAGGDRITLYGVFPQDALPEIHFMAHIFLPSLFNDTCVFTSSQVVGNVRLVMAANRTVY